VHANDQLQQPQQCTKNIVRTETLYTDNGTLMCCCRYQKRCTLSSQNLQQTNRFITKTSVKLDLAGQYTQEYVSHYTGNQTSSAVSRVYLLHPRQNQHHFTAIVWVYLMRVWRVGPNWIVLKIDSLQCFQWFQMIHRIPARYLIAITLPHNQQHSS